MLDLPITRAEVRMSARRWTTYAVRACFGLLLLMFFWIFHRTHESWSTGRPMSGE